jgi:hypothetical protein
MVSILSIDFDYFLNVSSEERDVYFPKGSEEIPKDNIALMWEERYKQYPELKKVGVINDYYLLKNYLLTQNLNKENFYKSDTHTDIKNLVHKIPRDKQLYIVNVDFHHDYYHYFKGKDNYNCGNWLRRLVEERPDTKVKWIRRNDSQLFSLEGMFPFEHTTDIKSIFKEKFDYVFICKSPEWSPPHLNGKYEELSHFLSKGKIA